MSSTAPVRSIRRLFAEIRKQLPENSKLKDTVIARFTLEVAKEHKETDERLCLQKKELLHRLDAFTTYLESSRRVAEIQKKYHHKQERSVESAANLVGLGLPKSPNN